MGERERARGGEAGEREIEGERGKRERGRGRDRKRDRQRQRQSFPLAPAMPGIERGISGSRSRLGPQRHLPAAPGVAREQAPGVSWPLGGGGGGDLLPQDGGRRRGQGPQRPPTAVRLHFSELGMAGWEAFLGVLLLVRSLN